MVPFLHAGVISVLQLDERMVVSTFVGVDRVLGLDPTVVSPAAIWEKTA